MQHVQDFLSGMQRGSAYGMLAYCGMLAFFGAGNKAVEFYASGNTKYAAAAAALSVAGGIFSYIGVKKGLD